LLVLDHAVATSAGDALGTPPEQWRASPDGATFNRSLAAANWSIDDDTNLQGVTGPDGRFSAGPLSPGPHTLQINKTIDGNLAAVSVPFSAGDDGSVDLVVQLSWGQARSSFSYTHDGATVGVIQSPTGSWLRLQQGRITAFGDAGRTFVDADGDGQFDRTDCSGSSTPLPTPYACSADGTCSDATTHCTCVSSCPACDDCLKRVCVPSCPPVEISALAVSGPAQLVVGQSGSLAATATLSDGTAVDVTGLVGWLSSAPGVAAIDSWGTVSTLQIGKTSITATFGTVSSPPRTLEVTARPALLKILVQNVSCVFPLGDPTATGGAIPAGAAPGQRTDLLPVPNCTQVVQIGATIQFRAVGEFDLGYYQDITDEVQWIVTPLEVGSVVTGLFTAEQAGTATLTASLSGVVSDPTTIRVVTQPTVVALSIYADNGGFPVLQGTTAPEPVASGIPCFGAGPEPAQFAPCCCPGPLAGDAAAPCRCTYTITVLRGDQLHFHATAQYDTGTWQDVTEQVVWRSSDAAVAAIDAAGVMHALQAGDASIDAVLEAVASDPAGVHVVDHATLQSLSIYQEGTDRVVAKGDQRFFHANASYDVGIWRDVTAEALWRSSDDAVGGFDSPGVFTGRAAGTVQVWAELEGVKSNMLSLQVFETSELSYCDPAHINRALWADDFNRVTLESDCAVYRQPGTATLRYSVTEIQPHGGIFNPCLDLYVFKGNTKVRTIREQGCGEPFLPAAAVGRDQEVLKYQLRAFWDLKDDAGLSVAPGHYTIYGRFYLYYDPVVSLDVTVLSP